MFSGFVGLMAIVTSSGSVEVRLLTRILGYCARTETGRDTISRNAARCMMRGYTLHLSENGHYI